MSDTVQLSDIAARLPTEQYIGAAGINGPLVIVGGARDVAYGETVVVTGPDGRARRGRVVEVSEDRAVVEVWSGTSGLVAAETRVRFAGRPLEIPVAREMLGRVFSGSGDPLDGLPRPVAERLADVNGLPINPTARQYPRSLIVTGISVIDCMNTLIRGQKLPIFSAAACRTTSSLRRSCARRTCSRRRALAIVFVALGIRHDDAEFFGAACNSGALNRTAMCLNLASDAPWSASWRRAPASPWPSTWPLSTTCTCWSS